MTESVYKFGLLHILLTYINKGQS